MRLLSIDFDYWVPLKAEWDFGHQENNMMILGPIWSSRAAGWLARDQDYEADIAICKGELCKPEGLGVFLRNLGSTFAPNSMAFGESHASAHDWFKDVEDGEMWHIDAHHDIQYVAKELSCENWVRHLVEEGKLRSVNLVYPKWRMTKEYDVDWREETEEIVEGWRKKGVIFNMFYGLDRLPKKARYMKTFMCRSGAWVPPWLDSTFLAATMNLLVAGDQTRYTTYTYDTLDDFVREFDIDSVTQQADQLRELMQAHRPA